MKRDLIELLVIPFIEEYGWFETDMLTLILFIYVYIYNDYYLLFIIFVLEYYYYLVRMNVM